MWITACICGFWSISHKSPNTWTSPLIYSTQANHNRSQHALAPPNHIYYYFFSKLLTYSCGSHSYFIWKYDRNVIKTSFSKKTSYIWYQPSLVSKLSLFKHCFHIPCMYSFKALFIIKPLCSGYFQWNVLSACCFFCNALQLQLTVNVFPIVLAAHRSSWKHPLTLIHYCRLSVVIQRGPLKTWCFFIVTVMIFTQRGSVVFTCVGCM